MSFISTPDQRGKLICDISSSVSEHTFCGTILLRVLLLLQILQVALYYICFNYCFQENSTDCFIAIHYSRVLGFTTTNITTIIIPVDLLLLLVLQLLLLYLFLLVLLTLNLLQCRSSAKVQHDCC